MDRLLKGIKEMQEDLQGINGKLDEQRDRFGRMLDDLSGDVGVMKDLEARRKQEPELDLFGEPAVKPGDPEKAAVLVAVKRWYLAVRAWKGSGSENTKTRKELLDQCLEQKHALRDVAEVWMQQEGRDD